MTAKKIFESIQEEDFVINVRPVLLENNEWSGDVKLTIMVGENNPLDDEDYGNMLHFVKMICSTVPLMETSSDLRDVVNTYVLEEIYGEMEIDFEPEQKESKGKIVDITDNVHSNKFNVNF